MPERRGVRRDLPGVIGHIRKRERHHVLAAESFDHTELPDFLQFEIAAKAKLAANGRCRLEQVHRRLVGQNVRMARLPAEAEQRMRAVQRDRETPLPFPAERLEFVVQPLAFRPDRIAPDQDRRSHLDSGQSVVRAGLDHDTRPVVTSPNAAVQHRVPDRRRVPEMTAQEVEQDAGHENRREAEPAERVRIDKPICDCFRFHWRLEMIQSA